MPGLTMKYFILKPRQKCAGDHYAEASRKAMSAYADSIRPFDPELGDDLDRWVVHENKFANKKLWRSVNDLYFSIRIENCMKHAGIKTVYQLVQKKQAELLKIKRFGRKSLNEIKEVISEMGLRLGEKF